MRFPEVWCFGADTSQMFYQCADIIIHGHFATLGISITLIPAWICNHILSKVWDYIIYPFPNLGRWSLRMDKLFLLAIYNGCNYLSMLGFKLIHVSRRGPWMNWKWHVPIIWSNADCLSFRALGNFSTEIHFFTESEFVNAVNWKNV